MLDMTKKTPYTPTPEESAFITDAYRDFIYDRRLRTQAQPLLDGRTLQEFWDESEKEYNVLVGPEDINDPVTPYASSISRDKSNVFITNITQQLLYPSVAAQNSAQEIDRVISRVSRSLLEWQTNNDGRPAESGLQKNARNIHKMVVTGTAHVQDDVDEEGKLVSNIVPNEEIYIPNLFQPNIQLQGHVIRMQNGINYEQAEMELGGLQKFQDHVVPMASAQFKLLDESAFRQLSDAINPWQGVHVIRIFRPVPRDKFLEYKRKGLLPKHVKKAKYFNIIVNGVLMFKPENLMPYHHGHYPISKGIFEFFSNPEFYYGNSLPNKARHDKKWLDGWKMLIRYKGKLSAMPPLITLNGSFVDSDIVVPGMITQAPSGMTKEDIIGIPGLQNGVTTGDLALMQDGVNDIDRSTTAPQTGGNQGSNRTTAREALIVEANAQKALSGIVMQVKYLVEARTIPILSMSYQFLPRQDIRKIAIHDQALPGGNTGTMEVIFMDPTELTAESLAQVEMAIYKQEKESTIKGQPKKIVLVNKEYVTCLDYYVNAIADNLLQETGALREAKATMHFDKYMSRPDIFNIKSAARKLVQEYGDDESEMIINNEQEKVPGVSNVPGAIPNPGAGSGAGQNPLVKMNQQGAAPVADNSAPLPTY